MWPQNPSQHIAPGSHDYLMRIGTENKTCLPVLDHGSLGIGSTIPYVLNQCIFIKPLLYATQLWVLGSHRGSVYKKLAMLLELAVWLGARSQRAVTSPGVFRHGLGPLAGCPCVQGSLSGAGLGIQLVRVDRSLGSGTA